MAYRWEVEHASADTIGFDWTGRESSRKTVPRSEWESSFLLPVGTGIRIQPHPRLRLVAGMEFEPTWTKSRIRYSSETQNLSGSGFHLSTSPVWTFGLDWVYTTNP